MRTKSHGYPTMALIIVVSMPAILASCTVTPEAPGPADPLDPSMPPWAADVETQTGVELAPAEASGLVSMPWSLAEISSDRRTLTVAFFAGDGDCVAHVGYTTTDVGDAIVLAEWSSSRDGEVCADKGEVGLETIALSRPLDGQVSLVHEVVDPRYDLPGIFD